MILPYQILGTGSYLPDLSVSNERFSEILETNDEWISSRTGIKSRHFSSGEATWEMGVKAAKKALEMAELSGNDIDIIIVSTITPDYTSPNMACIIQAELGAEQAFCFDVNAACTGFIQSFDIAIRYLTDPEIHNVLIVSPESLSKVVDFSNRRTCVLFGDGAGAMIVSNRVKAKGEAVTPEEFIPVDPAIYNSFIGADGKAGHNIVGKAFDPVRHPFIEEEAPDIQDRYNHQSGIFMEMNGQDVYRFATTMMPYAVEEVLKKSQLSLDEIDFIVPHQANERILISAAKRLKVPMSKVISHIDVLGNTSSASIPICLDMEVRQGRIKRGQTLIMTGFGGGLTYGALVCKF